MSPFADPSRLAAVAALLAALGGCANDPGLENTDAITPQLGDAVAANKVAQTIDPWPRYVSNADIPANGRRARTAAERYYNGTILPPVPATTSTVAVSANTPTPAAAATTN